MVLQIFILFLIITYWKFKHLGFTSKGKTIKQGPRSCQCPWPRVNKCRLLDEMRATGSQFQTPALTHGHPC